MILRFGARLSPLLALLACDEPCPGPLVGGEYIAMQDDFAAWRRWERFEVGSPDPRLGTAPRAVYRSARPDPDSGRYPTCARIVKVAETEGDPTSWLMVAMAKRGGAFNDDGARGWEWFDLDLDAEQRPRIDWRGPVPPEGRGYECALGEDEAGADGIGDCNTCHAAAAGDDYVLTPELWPGAR